MAYGQLHLEGKPGHGSAGSVLLLLSDDQGPDLLRHGQPEIGRRQEIDWRKEVGLKLMGLQDQDGSWINKDASRWWENEKPLVTAYSIIALSYLHRGQ